MKQLGHTDTMKKMQSLKTDLILCLCGVSAENLGLIMRTCDVFSVKEILYFGREQINLNKVRRISRQATIPVKYVDGIEVFDTMKKEGYKIVAIEITDTATPLRSAHIASRTCFILGNEQTGVPQELLDIADCAYYIEMIGDKISSLNVSISAAIAVNKYVETMLDKNLK